MGTYKTCTVLGQCHTHALLYHFSFLLGLNFFVITPPHSPSASSTTTLWRGPSPTHPHSLAVSIPPHPSSASTTSTCRSSILYSAENQKFTRMNTGVSDPFFLRCSPHPSIVTSPSKPGSLCIVPDSNLDIWMRPREKYGFNLPCGITMLLVTAILFRWTLTLDVVSVVSHSSKRVQRWFVYRVGFYLLTESHPFITLASFQWTCTMYDCCFPLFRCSSCCSCNSTG